MPPSLYGLPPYDKFNLYALPSPINMRTKATYKVSPYCYNHLHNILRLFDVLPNFHFTTSETMRDYYL